MNHLRRKLKRKPVTLIVGIICRDGIVLAADSQTTWGSGKSWDARKMMEIVSPIGRALVGESGAVLTSSRVVDELQKLWRDTSPSDGPGLERLAEIAIRNERTKLREQHFDCSSEELQQIIELNELDCGLMLAHYVGNSPMIHTVEFTTALTRRCKSIFEVLGSGNDLAAYLLSDLCLPDSDFSTAALTAVHVVETVKRHDPYCGGPTRLGVLRAPNWRDVSKGEKIMELAPEWWSGGPLWNDSLTDELVAIVSSLESQVKQQRGELVREALRHCSQKISSRILKEIDEEVSKRNREG